MTKLERERKRSQNARPSRHGVNSFAQASGIQRTEGKLCAAAGAGRTRAAEGNNRQENFSPLKSDGPHFSFREKSWRAWARRRQFTSGDKRRILDAADRCTQPGEIGALLRKEGIYSSHLTTWRRQRAAAERAALAPQKGGCKVDPAQTEDRRVLQLTQENDRLRRKLAQANAIIDVQKKLCALLGLSTDETPSEGC